MKGQSKNYTYASWHPLLVRTLKNSIDTRDHFSRFRSGTALAILSRLPVPKASLVVIETVLPLLRAYIDNFNLIDALQYDEEIDEDFGEEIFGRIADSWIEVKKPRKNKRYKTRNSSSNVVDEKDSETDKEFFRRDKIVHVHECVLESDSDGFAAYAGDISPAGQQAERSLIKENAMCLIYKNLYGKFPTVLSSLQSITHALVVLTRFSAQINVPAGVVYLTNFISKDYGVSVEKANDFTYLCSVWFKYQRILGLCVNCIDALTTQIPSVIGCDIYMLYDSIYKSMIVQLQKNTEAIAKLQEFLRGPINLNDFCVSAFRNIVSRTNENSFRLLKLILTVIQKSGNFEYLSSIGQCIVTWRFDPMFIEYADRLFDEITDHLNIISPKSQAGSRFCFELFASLVDFSELTLCLLDWCRYLPAGFHQAITGQELLGSLIPHIVDYQPLICSILKKHLAVIPWISNEKPVSNSIPLTTRTASSAVTMLVQQVLSTASVDILIQICTLVLPHCDSADCEYLISECIVPAIQKTCNKCNFSNDGIPSVEMSKDAKDLLKELELLAAHLKTKSAAAKVIELIVVPHREFYFSASELQDVFVAVCSKSSRLAPQATLDSGLCEWLVDRLNSCTRHISMDVWVLMEDSAAHFSKLLLSILNIICDILEDNLDIFSKFSERLLGYASTLVDLCFEWMSAPSDVYRSIKRVAEVTSKALFIHLSLSSDKVEICTRFSSALYETLSKTHSTQLNSCVVCSLLEKCISRFPTNLGSLSSINEESDDEEEDVLQLQPPRSLLHPHLVVTVIDLTTKLIENFDQVDSVIEFMVQKICKQLQAIDRHCQNGAQWLPYLFPLRDALINLKTSPSVIYTLHELLGYFIKRSPSSVYLNELIRAYFENHQYKDAVISAFVKLFLDPPSPTVSLVFPQPAIRLPAQVKAEHDLGDLEKNDQDNLENNSTPSNMPKTIERLLSSYRSDDDTESDIKRERRSQSKGQFQKPSTSSAVPSFKESLNFKADASNPAASFTLGENHSITSFDGLTLSFWLKREVKQKSKSNTPLLLASLGGERLSAQVIMNDKGKLFVDIIASPLKTLSRLKLKGHIKEKKWTHFAFGMKVTPQAIMVKASVGDSWSSFEVPMVIKVDNLIFPMTVSFGSIRKRSRHIYYMSTIFGFKGLLGPSCLLTLSGLGCQLSSLAETNVQHLVPNLAPIVTYRIVAYKQSFLESVTKDINKYVQKLQRSVVFIIRACSAQSYGVSILPADIEPSALVGKSPLSMAQIKEYPITWHGNLEQRNNASVDINLIPLGGIKFLIYLFVKSVNDGLPKKTQLSTLDLLLQSLRRDCFYTVEAERIKTHLIIARTLSSPLAICDETTMELLIRYCIEWTPSLRDERDVFDEPIGPPPLDPYQAVIREPKLLALLCCRCELWRSERFAAYRRFIGSIAHVLDPSTCKIPAFFNRGQLSSTEMLPKFLHCLLEMIQDTDNFPDFTFDTTFASDVASIVQSLLGLPESPMAVTHLWHFIFLSHPASFTYIDHRVQGHSEWLKPELIRDEPEGELTGDSPLCQVFKKIVNTLGQDRMSEMWKNGSSPFEIRRLYEAELKNLGLQSSEDISKITEQTRNLDLQSSEDDLRHTESKISLKNEKQERKWVISLRASLMNLLSTVLQNGADSLMTCLQNDIMSWHAIVVLLSHQSDSRIREAAVDLLQKFLHRAPAYTKIVFLRLSGFHILGSQLRSEHITFHMADNLFSMMCGETIRLGDGLDQSHLAAMNVDSFACDSLYSTLIAFEQSVPNAPLFWNIANALLKTFENNTQLQQAMIAAGLVDSMVNVLRRIAYVVPTADCDIVVSERHNSSLQLEAWSSFAQRIVTSAVPYSDDNLNNACERFIWLLLLADIQSAKDMSYPEEKRCLAHKVIRSQLCQLLLTWIESVQSVFSDEGKSASATSSVDSLYNQTTSSTTSSPSEDYDYCDDVAPPERNILDGTSPLAAFIAGSFANLREKINLMGPISRRSLKCNYQKRIGPCPLATVDVLTRRIIFALDSMSTVFTVLLPAANVPEEETSLFHFYIHFLYTSWKKDIQQAKNTVQTIWNRLILYSKDRCRVLLAQLVAFVMFPAHKKMHETSSSPDKKPSLSNWNSNWIEEKRRIIVRALAHELNSKASLSSLLNVNLDYEYALCLGLYEMAFMSEIKPEYEGDIARMIRFFQTSKTGSSFERFTPDYLNNLNTEEILSMHSYSQYRKGILAQLRSKTETVRDEEAKLTAHVGEMAMAVTCEVVEEQNLPRKIFIKSSKIAIGDFVEAENTLLSISKELCHPESSGYERRHWPVGWALDPTEGPARERRRLLPFYYPFDIKFFKDGKQNEVKENIEEAPLQRLLSVPLSTRSTLENAQIDEPIRLFLDVTVLRGTFECKGEMLIGQSAIHFVGDTAKSTQKGTVCSVITLGWKFEQLKEIQTRNHLLNDIAYEIFTTNGDTYLIVFQNVQKRLQFKNALIEHHLDHLFPNSELQINGIVSAWRNGQLSNFEYLMYLNKFAGRSFNDLMQYPVFPFILSDYTSSILNLNNSASYRILSRPMAIQDKRMEAHYVSTYNCLQAECTRTSMEVGPLHFGPYHYGSHYSNSGIVVHYLVRLSPYTQIALEYQDNNFDIPDRLFNSIESTWRLSSSESTTDFKELIPEFFCLPEFLRNKENLKLGIRQGGEEVGDVRLPAWTPEGNPRLFILIHRQALESHYVTQNLHSWIDLIFGFKQTGKAALDAVNVFHPATYMGRLNIDELPDELAQSALRTMVKSYGQMPIQIFTNPLLPIVSSKDRKEKSKCSSPIASVDGLRWGDYVGSPDQDASQIQVVLSIKGIQTACAGKVITLPDGTSVGIPLGTLIVTTSVLDNPKDQLSTSRSVVSLGALSYSFSDLVLRFRYIKPSVEPWINLVCLDKKEISCMEYSSTNNILFLSFKCGLIRLYKLELTDNETVSITQLTDLLAHHSAINCLSVSDEFSVALSGDQDGKVIVWDTNRLSFVRVLRRGPSAVTALCVSSTTADVAVVSQQGSGSCVELYSINGDLIGSIKTDSPVTCVAMTNQKEGLAINCMALGMEDGHIRLCEMWCLTIVQDIWHENHVDPITSLAYCSGGKKLYAVQTSGRVLCWQTVSSITRGKTPKFTFINPHDLTC